MWDGKTLLAGPALPLEYVNTHQQKTDIYLYGEGGNVSDI